MKNEINVSSKFGDVVGDTESKLDVYHIRKPQVLIQASGYLKYKYRDKKGIYFRGQRSLYSGTFRPTLYRNIKTWGTITKYKGMLNSHIDSIKNGSNIFKNIVEQAHEPLLQHYGINTSWVDVVDNIWIALWFACFRACSIGKDVEYIHFERRNPRYDGKYAYILMVGADLNGGLASQGYTQGPETELVDLRIACRSTFVRPHAQHGLLVRLRGEKFEYNELIKGIIRIDLEDALDCLGEGNLLSPNVLFPSPFYDFGYGELLKFVPKVSSRALGKIHYIGT